VSRTRFSLSGLNSGPAKTDAKSDRLKPVLLGCEEIEPLAVLYACNELNAADCERVEAHTKDCPACADVVAREARLQQAIASLEQPADSLDRSGLLLAQCRSELAEALDDRAARGNRPAWRSIFSPVTWWGGLRYALVYHPAMSMAVLVVAGFLAGVAGQRLPVTAPQVAAVHPVMTVSPSPKITDQQLQSAENAHVQWVTPAGSGAPTVQVQMMSQTPMSIVGAPDDADVVRALTFVLENSQRFDPDARLDSLNVLRTRAADPEVRRSLMNAARQDHNPGVRMKALEALQGFEQDPAVRQTILDALQNDDNSGVRVVAIDLLVSALQSDNAPGPADPQELEVLRDRQKNDSNNYVRLQSAAALRLK
jgi:HEAT repeats